MATTAANTSTQQQQQHESVGRLLRFAHESKLFHVRVSLLSLDGEWCR